MTRAQVEEVLERGGELNVSEILLCRVRYLTEGGAIGSSEFLREVFEENRERFSDNRSIAGRRMRGSDWGDLEVLRGLQQGIFG